VSAPATTRSYAGLTIPAPGTFVIDPAHSEVGFVARHLMVSKVRGSFTQVSGEITVAEDPLASTVTVHIPTESINTGVADRDTHLRNSDFLDVEKYPELTFRSTGLTQPSGDKFKLNGELTIREVTRPVALDVEFDGVAVSPWGQEVVAFSASSEIDRGDFGITWNQALEAGGVLIGKKVKIELSIEATRQG
jgi:polyisoprenoid-binding protein YceI